MTSTTFLSSAMERDSVCSRRKDRLGSSQHRQLMTVLEVRSVNVGLTGQIGARKDKPVLSAIRKQPVRCRSISVGWINLAGDEQTDRSAHGGTDKAIYAYPEEHLVYWRSVGLQATAGTFGENITSRGLTEAAIHLGDRFAWGDCELIVTQPRTPCYKLAMHLRRPDIAKLMISTGRCGWYLRVLQAGSVDTTAPMHRTVHRADLPTIDQVFAWTMRAPRDPDKIRRTLTVPELAARYADAITGLAR
jgi:MOSC domain-containing protein YiiM